MSVKTVVIVDDEAAARQSLREVIEGFDELEIVAEAADGKSAIEHIMLKRPDMVFLDIEMPELTGFDVARATQHVHYQLVFLTAYEHYALRAFDTNAIDYLIKPARPELIAKSIRKMLHQEVFVQDQRGTSVDANRLILGDGAQQKLIEYDHVNFIESIGRYRRVHLTEAAAKLHGTDTIISDVTLDSFCHQLPEDIFFRLHRSYIINSKWLLELRLQSRRHFVRMAGTDMLIPVSRGFLNILKQHIHQSDQ